MKHDGDSSQACKVWQIETKTSYIVDFCENAAIGKLALVTNVDKILYLCNHLLGSSAAFLSALPSLGSVLLLQLYVFYSK